MNVRWTDYRGGGKSKWKPADPDQQCFRRLKVDIHLEVDADGDERLGPKIARALQALSQDYFVGGGPDDGQRGGVVLVDDTEVRFTYDFVNHSDDAP